jgi:hypothetical protein
MALTRIVEAVDVVGHSPDRCSPDLKDGTPAQLALQHLEERLTIALIRL